MPRGMDRMCFTEVLLPGLQDSSAGTLHDQPFSIASISLLLWLDVGNNVSQGINNGQPHQIGTGLLFCRKQDSSNEPRLDA